MMRIGIVDAEIVGKSKHRFPNLCSMKLSAWHKQNGDSVKLLTSYNNIGEYDKVYISKVFTKTEVPPLVLDMPNVSYGGTGFFYDNAPPLPNEIEHAKPDYHLYDDWVQEKIATGIKPIQFRYYTDYSIGFLTRGCFRQCQFCVNRNSKRSVPASPLDEFLDTNRKKICLLDDNFFACSDWRDLIKPIIESGKRFQFKQGLDERLLTQEIVKEMNGWRYDGEFIFAFDNIADKQIITDKLKLFQQPQLDWKHELKFYVFAGYDRQGKQDCDFYRQDIMDLFERIMILKSAGAKPYVMRHANVYNSQFSSFYATVAAWCNQPAMFKTFSFREFAQCRGMRKDGYAKYKRNVSAYLANDGSKGSEWRSMEMVAEQFPDIAMKYFDM